MAYQKEQRKKEYRYKEDRNDLKRALKQQTDLLWIIVWLLVVLGALTVGMFVRLLLV